MMVLDGGPCPVGIESSIVDLSSGVPVLMRPGVLERAAIEKVLGQPLREPGASAPRASGTLASHYAPRARVRLMTTMELAQSLHKLGARGGQGLAVYSRTVLPTSSAILHRPMAETAPAAAQELFAVLRELDDAGVDLIWVESPPDHASWDGVRDRLTRAAADIA
jgi:L-threonylcarbamoyladenylate synthase